MSERFKVTKFDDPSGKTYKNYGATSAENDVELKGKLLPDSGAYGRQARIVGGNPTTISQYPSMVAVLFAESNDFYDLYCGGSIINRNSVLTAASCTSGSYAQAFRIRAGSTFANSGGSVYQVAQVVNHPSFEYLLLNADIGILKTNVAINLINQAVQPATYAGANYIPPDGAPLRIAGWGLYGSGYDSEYLQDAQVNVVNQQVCKNSFTEDYIQDTVICSAAAGVGPCNYDYGSPVFHDGVVVGVTTYSVNCGYGTFGPSVNVRVSSYILWIQANA